ncbi:isocitrate/isopropylmalate dehydrogenase family protein [Thalassospiraceae bacterium LMO-JJ14]|nr:isocitrate/isopropylmalate dehydrogenase family protein [Thalassospiraceae bacterium LMO-JJ14]
MKIMVLPGDGIGPEIMDATLKVVRALDDKYGLGFDLQTREIGLASLATRGSTLPDDVVEECKEADGTILGPVDSYAYPPRDQGGVNPSGTMRKELDLYANIRPSKTYQGVPSMAAHMDMVVVRENTEGFYADRNMFLGSGEFMPTEDVALSVRKITRQGSRRIAKQAFEMAARRRKKVTVVHKANVLKVTDGLFLHEVMAEAEAWPDIEVEELIIDAATAHLIRRPADFDVLVTTNMYGDILSDECAELCGGLGLGGSINAGDNVAIAQAAHGSAPDIAGQGKANPSALMVSVAMLMDWMGSRTNANNLIEAAAAFQGAVEATLADETAHTPDLGGKGSTSSFGDAVAAKVGE